MTSSTTNKRTKIRFGGAEDNSIRSAWKTTNKSFQPPSPAERKATLGRESLEKAKANAALVAALNIGSEYDDDCDGDSDLPKPILKVGDQQQQHHTDENVACFPGTRSAWDSTESSGSNIDDTIAPCPAQRQATLNESDLIDACASIAAAVVSNNNDSFSSSLHFQDSFSLFRDSSSKRSSSVKDDGLMKDAPIKEEDILVMV
jgi:hypothetical protein